MRPITFHAINPANEALKVVALDGPGPGGASHEYAMMLDRVDDPMRDGNPGQPRILGRLLFQNGPVKENGVGVNGLTHEALLAVLIDRLEGFQSGQYANPHNQLALDHLHGALNALHARTRGRIARGVEGTRKV